MITMVTFLRGGFYASLDVFEQLPDGSKLIATVNNFGDGELIASLGGTPIMVEPWDGQGGEWGRHEYVASLRNAAIPTVTTPLTMLMDDDVVPPVNTLSKFLQGFAGPTQVATCAIYPFSDQTIPGVTLYPVFYNENMQAMDGASLPNKRDPVFTAAMGMSLWRTAVLKSCLPVSVIDRFGSPMGTEYDLGLKVKALNKLIYIDGRVRCEHSTP